VLLKKSFYHLPKKKGKKKDFIVDLKIGPFKNLSKSGKNCVTCHNFHFQMWDSFKIKREELVSSASDHWTRYDVDTCLRLDTCPYPNESSGHWPLDRSQTQIKK